MNTKHQWRTERREHELGELVWFKNTNPATTGNSAQAYSAVASDLAIDIASTYGRFRKELY